jgi:type II secretory pathway pseudopilin PulG
MTPSRRRERGFALLEAVVAMFLLGVLATSALGGLMFAMKGARSDLTRASASAWAQAELDYLSLHGYANLTASSRTLTPSDGYTTYGGYAEPTMPEGFDHAVVSIQDVPGLQVKQLTVTLFGTPSARYTVFSTYLSDFSYP